MKEVLLSNQLHAGTPIQSLVPERYLLSCHPLALAIGPEGK